MLLLTAFFLRVISLSLFPSTLKSSDTVIVKVKYPRQPISRAEGQLLTLRCTAEYEEAPCGNISVGWCRSLLEDSCQRLTDPDTYLVQVSETKINGGFRHRDALVTFTGLTVHDAGLYQCKAVCQHTGAAAMGHFISVNVTGKKKTIDITPGNTTDALVNLNSSDQRNMDVFLLSISAFLLSWIHISSAC